jgi:hypothetical protein
MTEKQKRDELIAKRNLVFARFLGSPMDIRLAVEIKNIDDQIAEITERIRTQDRQAEIKDRNRARLHERFPGIEKHGNPPHNLANTHVVRNDQLILEKWVEELRNHPRRSTK